MTKTRNFRLSLVVWIEYEKKTLWKNIKTNANGLPTEHLVANKNLLDDKSLSLGSEEIPNKLEYITGDNSKRQVLTPLHH